MIGWDYVFTDPGDQQTTHHQFYDRAKISAGKSKLLSRFIPAPPTRTINADGANSKLVEEVVINYIEYQDGSKWRRNQEKRADTR